MTTGNLTWRKSSYSGYNGNCPELAITDIAAREARGRLVRETWIRWAREQPFPKPSWLTGWDQLDEGQREVDMRIGAAIAAAERQRIRKLATEYRAAIAVEGDWSTLVPFADLLDTP